RQRKVKLYQPRRDIRARRGKRGGVRHALQTNRWFSDRSEARSREGVEDLPQARGRIAPVAAVLAPGVVPVDQAEMIALPDGEVFAPGGGGHGDDAVVG